MQSVLLPAVSFLVQIIFIFCTGSIICHFVNREENSVGLSFLMGFFAVFALFELTALPFILLKQSLHALAVFWIALMCILCLLALILCRKEWSDAWRSVPKKILSYHVLLPLVYAAVIIQVLIVLTHMDYTVDAAYYVGKVSTDVYHNSLGLFDPNTGVPLKTFNVRYLFSTFPDYNAVFASVFRVHPMIQAKTIMPVIVILTVNLLYGQIGRFLFRDDRKKTSVFVFLLFLFNLYSNTIFTSSQFLLTRTYEGKTILGNLIVPGILLGLLYLYKGDREPCAKMLLLAAAVGSTAFSSSSMLMVPIALGVGYLVLSILKGKWRLVGWFMLYILPNALTALCFLLYKLRILSFAI